MLTKKECKKALNLLRNVQIGESEDVEQANDVFEQLIDEHFSNLPLKFEKIKEGDFVFDKDFNGLGGEWLKVYMKRVTEHGEKVLICGACGSGEHQTRSYKEDRFYRKEIEYVD